MKRKLIETKRMKMDLVFKATTVDKVNHTVEGVFSAENVDRHGEVVVQDGWILDNFRKNPVVLYAHNHDGSGTVAFPVAKALTIDVNEQKQLVGKLQFAVEEYDQAATAFALVEGGYINMFSVGFMNNKYQIDQANDVVYLLENELIEVSLVPVGANQLALAKQKGIDVASFEEPEPEEKEKETEPEKEPEQISAEKALEVLSAANIETIRAAISGLQGVLTAASEADTKDGLKVEHPSHEGGKRKIPVKLINRAIRALLEVKKTQ